MAAMIHGSSCSPSSAQYIKNENVKKFIDTHPDTVEGISRNHYVDDYVKSFHDEMDAINTTKAIIYIHRQGGFELRNFVSNSKKVLEELEQYSLEKSMDSVKLLDESQTDKILD